MTCLALHVTEAQGSVAVERTNGDIVALEFAAQGEKAPILLQQIERLFARAETRPENIDAIAVTTGPGSFTGIRVGLATAQGLALARGWRLFASDSLAAVAAAQAAGEPPLAVVLDARRGEVYAALYDRGPAGGLQVRVAPFCAAPAVAAGTIAAAAEPRGAFWIAGSGTSLVLPGLRAAHARVESAPEAPRPVAAALVEWVRSGAAEPLAITDLEPVYLRLSDAESKRPHRI